MMERLQLWSERLDHFQKVVSELLLNWLLIPPTVCYLVEHRAMKLLVGTRLAHLKEEPALLDYLHHLSHAI